MIKKICILSLSLLFLLIAGCFTTEGPTEVVETEEIKDTSEEETAPEPEALGLSVEEAVEIVVAAQLATFYVGSGGSDFVYESFDYEGLPYRYLGESLASWENLRAYLEPIYTPEAIDLFIEYMNIIEHEGRLAQPDADGGSIIDWSTAEVTVVEAETEEITYEFEVSYDSFTETSSITFVLTNSGWKKNYPLLY